MSDYFDIDFVQDETRSGRERRGTIVLGEFEESFVSTLGFWNEHAYKHQWRVATPSILKRERSALLTSVTDPHTSNFVRCWAMYREADWVIFQERVLFLSDKVAPFSTELAYETLAPRSSASQDDDPVSEWMLPSASIRAFVERQAALPLCR